MNLTSDITAYAGRPKTSSGDVLAYSNYLLLYHHEYTGGNDPDSWHAGYTSEAAHNYFSDTVYPHLFKTAGGEYVISYYYYYPFNDAINDHEGDWERINVVISSPDPETAQIVRVEYSFHEYALPLSDPNKYFVLDETHPVIFAGGYGEGHYYIPYLRIPIDEGSGAGSHGSFPFPADGNHRWEEVGGYVPDYGRDAEEISGIGRFIDWTKFEIKIIKNPECYDFENEKRMSWIGSALVWGHINVDSPGSWSPIEVGNRAPMTPPFQPRWNCTGGNGFPDGIYTHALPYNTAAESGYTPSVLPRVPVITGSHRWGSEATIRWWNSQPQDEVYSYVLCHDTDPHGIASDYGSFRVISGNATECTVTGLNPSLIYYFALVNHSDLGESEVSLPFTPPFVSPPPVPLQVLVPQLEMVKFIYVGTLMMIQVLMVIV